MQRFAATAVAIASFASGQLLVQPKKMLHLTHDPLTSEPDPELRRQLALEGFPTFMGVAEADENQQNDVLAPMHWHIVPKTGVVLLNPLVPLEYIYRHQHNAVVGGIWTNHHNEFAQLVAEHVPGGHILEIGGGHGYLAAKLLFSEAVKYWTIVDPNPVTTFAIPNLKIKGVCRGPRQAPARGRLCCALAHARAHLRPGSDGP